MTKVESWARHACRPANIEESWRWAERNIDIGKISPVPGMFRSDTAPWIKEPLEKLRDNRIRRVTIRCAAQTSKTTIGMIAVADWIANEPGPIQWVMAAQDEAKTFVNTRLRPFLEGCGPVSDQMPRQRKHNKTLEINFPEAPLLISGANSPSKLQGNPKRYLVLDEVRNYPKGALQTALKRTESFWNARELISSTGDTEGDDVDREFLAGDQRRYFVPCPHCSQEWEMKWEQMKWDDNETTRPGGEWNFGEVAKTIRYECPSCKAEIRDDFSTRKKMAVEGKWVPTNRNAPSDRVSYTWSAMISPLRPWKRIVEEFLTARVALKQGVVEPLKTWVTETMGDSWKESISFKEDLKVESDYITGETWEKESARFLTVDVQEDHFWFVVRAWSKDGESRMLDFGRLTTASDVKDKQIEHKIRDMCVLIDCSFDTANIYSLCCANGWVALRGDPRKEFPHNIRGRRVLSPHSKPGDLWGDPNMGKAGQGRQRCPVIAWSNPSVKDMLHRLKTGNGAYYGVPSDASQEWHRQMVSEAKRKIRNKKSGQLEWSWVLVGRRQNHLWDCECMQVVAAQVDGMLANPFQEARKPEVENVPTDSTEVGRD